MTAMPTAGNRRAWRWIPVVTRRCNDIARRVTTRSQTNAVSTGFSWAATAPHTRHFGWSRSLLATGTAWTLAATDTSVLFRATAGGGVAPVCDRITSASAYCLLSSQDLAKWLSVAFLLVVASGWRPRLTCVPHYWLTASFSATATLVDGSDHVATTLAALLMPVGLTDSRRWHWEPTPPQSDLVKAIGHAWLWLIRLQMAVIYLQAAAAKMSQPEWVDGTAMYYWALDPMFGVSGLWKAISDPILASPAVFAVTWTALLVEFSLAGGLFAPRWLRRKLFAVGIGFHALIAFGLGLGSFAFSMGAGLVLLLLTPRPGFDDRALGERSSEQEHNASPGQQPLLSGGFRSEPDVDEDSSVPFK